jgi:hypothetical protein
MKNTRNTKAIISGAYQDASTPSSFFLEVKPLTDGTSRARFTGVILRVTTPTDTVFTDGPLGLQTLERRLTVSTLLLYPITKLRIFDGLSYGVLGIFRQIDTPAPVWLSRLVERIFAHLG